MKIKNPIVFSGVKIIKDNSPPNEEDFKFARITKGTNWVFCHRDFRERELDFIEVENVFRFYDLVRFFYKGYCCAVNQRDFVEIKG